MQRHVVSNFLSKLMEFTVALFNPRSPYTTNNPYKCQCFSTASSLLPWNHVSADWRLLFRLHPTAKEAIQKWLPCCCKPSSECWAFFSSSSYIWLPCVRCSVYMTVPAVTCRLQCVFVTARLSSCHGRLPFCDVRIVCGAQELSNVVRTVQTHPADLLNAERDMFCTIMDTLSLLVRGRRAGVG